MATFSKGALVAVVLALLAAVLIMSASRQGSRPERSVMTTPASQALPEERPLLQAVEASAGQSRPGETTIVPGIECPDGASASFAEITEEWIDRQVQEDIADRPLIIERLARSDDPDHRLAAVLMSHSNRRDPAGQVENVAAILRQHPDHTLAFWSLVVMCGRALHHDICADAALSARAETIDKENSEVWALLAVYRDRREDPKGAVSAMQRAVGSATTSVYYAEQILLFERAFAAASDYGPSQRLVHAIGSLAALPLQHDDVFKACSRLSKSDMVWRRMCFDYGRLLEARARSLMTEQFGLAMQEKIARLDGDEDQARALRERAQSMSGQIDDDLGTLFDDQVNARYLEELSVYGERAALDFLHAEVERRRALGVGCE